MKMNQTYNIFVKPFVWLLFFQLIFSCNNPINEIKIYDSQNSNSGLLIKVYTSASGNLVYTVEDDGIKIISESVLGITIDGKNLGMQVEIGEPTFKDLNESYLLFGNKKAANYRAVEAIIPLSSQGIKYQLHVRNQGNGVAIRYVLPSESKYFDEEHTKIIPVNPNNVGYQTFENSYETEENYVSWDTVKQHEPLAGLLTIALPQKWLFISESNNANYPDLAFKILGNTISTFWPTRIKGFNLTDTLQHTTPWRIISIANSLDALVNATIMTDNCPPPSADFDFSFVKPGRILWQWCSVGEPQLNDQKEWYNAASKLRWEYYMIDDGWRTWKTKDKDQWQLLKEVIDYGKTKGIATIIWVDSKEIIKSKDARTAYLEKVKTTGAVGIKIDFIPPATEIIMKWYEETLQETAKLKLLTIFHGCVKPTGRERTWPHALTREGIRGNEWHMTRYQRVKRFDHDEIQPFTRFLSGAGDITPLVADPKQLNGFTLSHFLAQSIIQTSPLTCFYDHFKFYIGSTFEDILIKMPVVWDETRVLPNTQIGKTVGFARKNANDWWIGVVNGEVETSFTITFDFIKSAMNAIILSDVKNRNTLNRTEKIIQPNDTLKFNLKQGGGVFLYLYPKIYN